LIPTGQRDAMTVLLYSVAQTHPLPCPVCISLFDEWPEKGMLHHMLQIMRADEWCPDADFIAHMDADCIFTEPVTPEDYIQDGKPILRYEYFSKINQRHSGVGRWQECCQKCLPFPVLHEAMRCHPEVYHRGLYARARDLIAATVHKSCDDYVHEQQNAFPQTFCEFNTLGNVALHDFPEQYLAIEQTGDRVTPHNKLQQFWSHGAIDQPQTVWVLGRETSVVPIDFIKHVLA